MDRGRVVVAMSGGVDSSVAALLLAQAGYEVVGVTLRLWTLDRPHAAPMSRSCCSVEDIDDARRVCQAIGARHYVVNAEREFRARVVDYFFAEYERGRTPHPCIACNDRIKFDFLRSAPSSLAPTPSPPATTPASRSPAARTASCGPRTRQGPVLRPLRAGPGAAPPASSSP